MSSLKCPPAKGKRKGVLSMAVCSSSLLIFIWKEEGKNVSTRFAPYRKVHLVSQVRMPNYVIKITHPKGCSFYKLKICLIFHTLTKSMSKEEFYKLKNMFSVAAALSYD